MIRECRRCGRDFEPNCKRTKETPCPDCRKQLISISYQSLFAVEQSKKWNQAFPERRNIHQQLYIAVKSGGIKRPETCSKCGREAKIQAHHTDYKHYTHFVWLCSSCHKIEHNNSNIS